ncbi:hypothetical protein C443_00497 [Haloarcula argentinensis DSM 12282]|nr:hypothetical protein C443_00497 [Haloarcula argentinensis DSM 12282]
MEKMPSGCSEPATQKYHAEHEARYSQSCLGPQIFRDELNYPITHDYLLFGYLWRAFMFRYTLLI